MILESSCFICTNENQQVWMRTTAFARTINQTQESISHNITNYKVRYHSVFQAGGERSDGMVKQHTGQPKF